MTTHLGYLWIFGNPAVLRQPTPTDLRPGGAGGHLDIDPRHVLEIRPRFAHEGVMRRDEINLVVVVMATKDQVQVGDERGQLAVVRDAHVRDGNDELGPLVLR